MDVLVAKAESPIKECARQVIVCLEAAEGEPWSMSIGAMNYAAQHLYAMNATYPQLAERNYRYKDISREYLLCAAYRDLEDDQRYDMHHDELIRLVTEAFGREE